MICLKFRLGLLWRCWEQFLILCSCQLRMNMIKSVRKCFDPALLKGLHPYQSSCKSRIEIRYSDGVKTEVEPAAPAPIRFHIYCGHSK